MAAFPSVPHYLFEPVDVYSRAIRDAYKSFNYQLVNVALSDEDGEAWQIGFCRDGSGRVTHSKISDRKMSTMEDAQLIECKPVRKAKLDTAMQTLSPAAPWLLKVDVDGHELAILRGSASTLNNTSVVVIEAPMHELNLRTTALLEAGFHLFDIVDLTYYHDTLAQADLVFIRKNVVQANENLRPWQTKRFAWEAWRPLIHEIFRGSDLK